MKLGFGIPLLDGLIEVPFAGDGRMGADEGSSSIAIIGPEGTGKSVLALHLASRYYFDWCSQYPGYTPLVIYASSDLKHSAAKKIWDNFDLSHPGLREIPFERTEELLSRRNRTTRLPDGSEIRISEKLIDLQELTPNRSTTDKDILAYLKRDSLTHAVGFLDLAPHTAGDDWTFVNTLLGKLAERHALAGAPVAPYLLLVDSVAGFETFVGKHDACGLEQSRRARVAQCLRSAGASCHLVLVVEEAKEGERWPEEYVTDIVLRLRRRPFSGTVVRTVEVEKARARTIALGEHPFEILSSAGTSTGTWENADHPVSQNNYVNIHYSISHRNHVVAADPGKGRPDPKVGVAPFGIHFLDDLLSASEVSGRAKRGLRAGTATALIGETGTAKTILAEQFLAQPFAELANLKFAVRALWEGRLDPRLASDVVKQVAQRLTSPLILKASEIPPAAASVADNLDKLQIVTYWNECANRAIAETLEALGEAIAPDDPRRGLEEAKRRAIQRKEYLESYNLVSDTTARKLRIKDLTATCGPEVVCLHPDRIDDLFRLPQFLTPSVLLTTSDRNAKLLSQRICNLLPKPPEMGLDDIQKEDEWKSLARLIEGQLIVRRFDIAPITAASLFHVIQRM